MSELQSALNTALGLTSGSAKVKRPGRPKGSKNKPKEGEVVAVKAVKAKSNGHAEAAAAVKVKRGGRPKGSKNKVSRKVKAPEVFSLDELRNKISEQLEALKESIDNQESGYNSKIEELNAVSEKVAAAIDELNTQYMAQRDSLEADYNRLNTVLDGLNAEPEAAPAAE